MDIPTELLHILLVEDDDADAKAIQRAFKLARVNYPIWRAIDGLDAMEIVNGENDREKLPLYSIFLVDLNMPRMNGIQFITALRKNPSFQNAVVFVLTTSKRQEDELAAYDLKVAGYILKEEAKENFAKLIGLIGCYKEIVDSHRSKSVLIEG